VPTIATTGTIRHPKLTVTLALSINHQVYTITPIDHNDATVTRAFRLKKKHDGTLYDIAETEHGATCDCPDFEVRRNGIDPAGCKHVQSLRMMGMLAAVDVEPAPAVEPPPAPRKMPEGRCSKCARRGFAMQPDAKGAMVCYECRIEPCDICERTGTRRLTRNDGLTVCGECSKRQDEEAERRAFLGSPAPTPCCSPEATPCLTCEAAAPAVDVPTDDPGIEALNLPVELPDAYDDEAPELPAAEDYDPTPSDDAAYAAMITQRFLDSSAVLGLAEAIDHVADTFRDWKSPFGTMLAQAMEELALKCRMTESTTPAEFAQRAETLDAEVRAGWEKIGFENGQAAARPAFDINSPEALAIRRGKPSSGYAGGHFAPSPYCLT
jgi:hypothetical protein